MSREKVQFSSSEGYQLAAVLELPSTPAKAYALFAHCFTCGKDVAAATRIARSLTAAGIAVLRFDFTGLGGSQGDFANSNFSSNVGDLVSAAEYLRARGTAPSLLIGHSLGGTAVVMAAPRIAEAKAVVTIGAPATPAHIIKQFRLHTEEIEEHGEAEVMLAGRKFKIQRQFLDDLMSHDLAAELTSGRRALLVMHSPIDEIVSIDEASRIFLAARHPKSFISLGNADHLLSKPADAQYVATTIAAWASRYLPAPEDPLDRVEARGEIWVGEGNHEFLRDVHSDDHYWLADEPESVGGDNLGPDPYEHLLAALGTCTSMTIRMYANRKKWPLEDVAVRLTHTRKHAQDCRDCDEAPATNGAKLDVLSRMISFAGPLDDTQRQRLLEIADRCPVHRTLKGDLRIETEEGT